MSTASPDDELRTVLRRSQRLGYIGGTDLERHVAHALGFARAVEQVPTRALDLGSGGGLPGLVLARHWPDSSWVLLDGSQTRTTFLEHAVRELELDDRVSVVRGRAEEVGHEADRRSTFDLVVARSFGPPAVVAECAAPFLRIGGSLVVSEPPDTGDRWAFPNELADLGLERRRDEGGQPAMTSLEVGTYATLTQVATCPARFPRRVGIPAKRPLFGP